MRSYLIILSVILSLISCDSSKHFVKIGNKFLLESNYDEAANQYYNALLINPQNALAKSGLQHCAQIVLDNKFTSFSHLVLENNAPEAVRQYRYNKQYYNRVKSVNVDVLWPSMYDEVYEDIKNEYIGKLYDNGLQFMGDKKYEKAERVFTEIAEIDSDYKDVSVLRINSMAEPMYQKGIQLMQKEFYKDAYRCFDKVCSYDKTYKDALKLKQSALDKAIVGVGVPASRNLTATDKAEALINQKIITSLVNAKNPFLKIVDRNNIDKYLNEQQLGMNPNVDPNTVAKAGKILGLKYMLVSTLNEMYVKSQVPQTETKVGYEAYRETVQSPTGVQQYITRFKKVNYTESYQMRKVFYRIFYQLISVQSAEIVASDVLMSEKIDEQYYNKFDGNPQNLYPDLPVGNQLPFVSAEWRSRFQESKRELISIESLSNSCVDEIVQKLSSDISTYILQ